MGGLTWERLELVQELGDHLPIVLIKLNQEPKVCSVDSVGAFQQCYDPRVNQREVVQQEVLQEEPGMRWVEITMVIAVIAVIAGIVILMNNSKKKIELQQNQDRIDLQRLSFYCLEQ
ncbi:MAG: hypothetical protein QRY74_06550 [Chlamydia sp.]